MKQDSVVTIYLRTLISSTTLFNSFLRDSSMDRLNNGMTCNQLLAKISIFILIIIILRKRDKPVAHEVSNWLIGDSAAHILGLVMKVLLEDLPTLFQVILLQGPECVCPLPVDPLFFYQFLTLMGVKQIWRVQPDTRTLNRAQNTGIIQGNGRCNRNIVLRPFCDMYPHARPPWLVRSNL